MDTSRATVKVFLSKSGDSALFFLGLTLFARWLDPSAIGVFTLFVALTGMLSIPANLGIRGAVEKRMSEGQDAAVVLGTAVAFKLCTTIVVGIGVLLARNPLDRYVGADIAVLLAAYVFVKEFSRLYVGTVRGELRVGETAKLKVAFRVTWIASTAAFLSLDYGAVGMLYGLFVARVVQFGWAYWIAETNVGRPSFETLASLFAFAKYDTILSVSGRVYQWMDVLVIGYFLAQTAVGGYEMAWRISLLVLLVSNSFKQTLFPQFSFWDATESTDRVGGTVSTSLQYVLFVAVPAVFGAALYAEPILGYLFGNEYAFAGVALVLLMVEKVFQSATDVVGVTLRALDRVNLAARIAVASIALNLVLSPILVSTHGIAGAAAATVVAGAMNLVLNVRYLEGLVSFDLPYAFVGWYFVASVAMTVVLLALASIVPVTGVLTLFVHVFTGAVVYVAVLVGIPNVRKEVLSPSVNALIG